MNKEEFEEFMKEDDNEIPIEQVEFTGVGQEDANKTDSNGKISIDERLKIVDWYDNHKLNTDQMKMIRIARELDIRVGLWAKPEFSADQMFQIIEGHKNGINPKRYINHLLDSGQMEQMRLGLEKELKRKRLWSICE